jgi:hypothetical protein
MSTRQMCPSFPTRKLGDVRTRRPCVQIPTLSLYVGRGTGKATKRGLMPDDNSVGREDGELSSELERRVERTDILVQTALERISRGYPEQAIGGAALEDLQQMRPHLEEALAALVQIEERRKLTHKELSLRRAFKMLSEVRR